MPLVPGDKIPVLPNGATKVTEADGDSLPQELDVFAAAVVRRCAGAYTNVRAVHTAGGGVMPVGMIVHGDTTYGTCYELTGNPNNDPEADVYDAAGVGADWNRLVQVVPNTTFIHQEPQTSVAIAALGAEIAGINTPFVESTDGDLFAWNALASAYTTSSGGLDTTFVHSEPQTSAAITGLVAEIAGIGTQLIESTDGGLFAWSDIAGAYIQLNAVDSKFIHSEAQTTAAITALAAEIPGVLSHIIRSTDGDLITWNAITATYEVVGGAGGANTTLVENVAQTTAALLALAVEVVGASSQFIESTDGDLLVWNDVAGSYINLTAAASGAPATAGILAGDGTVGNEIHVSSVAATDKDMVPMPDAGVGTAAGGAQWGRVQVSIPASTLTTALQEAHTTPPAGYDAADRVEAFNPFVRSTDGDILAWNGTDYTNLSAGGGGGAFDATGIDVENLAWATPDATGVACLGLAPGTYAVKWSAVRLGNNLDAYNIITIVGEPVDMHTSASNVTPVIDSGVPVAKAVYTEATTILGTTYSVITPDSSVGTGARYSDACPILTVGVFTSHSVSAIQLA